MLRLSAISCFNPPCGLPDSQIQLAGSETPIVIAMTPTPSVDRDGPSEIIEWRGQFGNGELNALHAECFEHRLLEDDWWSQVSRFSIGWVCARRSSALIGFANVAWDGGVHAFILDTMVAKASRRHGLGKRLIREAVNRLKETNCEWLHVDFEPHLQSFYFDTCGFKRTDAGLISLTGLPRTV
jgi:GNAT superfamily N-acetyltransferase